jgi:Phage portal protein, SPP1 Gp6-like
MDYKTFFESHTKHSRFKNYLDGKKLYTGDHRGAFGVSQYEAFDDPSKNYIIANYPEVLTDRLVDLIFGEEPKIVFADEKNQKWWDNYSREDSFHIKIRTLGETASYAGEAVMQVGSNKDKIEIFQVENDCWFPIYNTSNPGLKPEGHIKKIKTVIDQKEYYMIEVHKLGEIEYTVLDKDYVELDYNSRVRLFEGVLIDAEIGRVQNRLVDKTECSSPLMFHLKNRTISGEFFGLSDYTIGLTSKVYGINAILNQNQGVLRKHADPKMKVPKSLIQQITQKIEVIKQKDPENIDFEFDMREKTALTDLYRSNKYDHLFDAAILKKLQFLGVEMGDVEPGYITWDGKLDQAFAQIDKLEKLIHQESGLAKILVDPEMATGAASGVAISRMAQPTISKAQKKISHLKDTLQRMIYTILELAQKRLGAELTPDYPTITFQDGLVNSVQETIDEVLPQLDSGVMSKEEAIQVIRNCDQKTAQKSLELIQKENDIMSPVIEAGIVNPK